MLWRVDIRRDDNPGVSRSKGGRMETPTQLAVTQDSKNTGVLIWIGTIFLGFIPGLIVYLVKKDDAYVQDQAKEALNWSITALIGYVAGMILMFVLVGVLVMVAVGICHLIFCVLGAVATSKGENFRVPFALRLIR
jgi:uncharacterized Tic20 family protein